MYTANPIMTHYIVHWRSFHVVFVCFFYSFIVFCLHSMWELYKVPIFSLGNFLRRDSYDWYWMIDNWKTISCITFIFELKCVFKINKTDLQERTLHSFLDSERKIKALMSVESFWYFPGQFNKASNFHSFNFQYKYYACSGNCATCPTK